MKFSEDITSGNLIRGYDSRGININGRLFISSLIISRHQLISDWPVRQIHHLNDPLANQLWLDEPEVILIGTGNRLQFPPPEIYAQLLGRGIGVEFMDSGAACRTYNILLGEERRVVAGIILNTD